MLRELIKQAAWRRCFDNATSHLPSRSPVASHQPVPADALKFRRLPRRTGMARSEYVGPKLNARNDTKAHADTGRGCCLKKRRSMLATTAGTGNFPKLPVVFFRPRP